MTITSLILALSVFSSCGDNQSAPSDSNTDNTTVTVGTAEDTDSSAVISDTETTLASDEAENPSTVTAPEETTASVPSTVEEIVEYYNIITKKARAFKTLAFVFVVFSYIIDKK